ncbi:uncharacterized protein [Physeter macrocephalus]|uniref:Basic proline-rich protein-like n=1 Tax=Physeter macrocephalus TaxID=9755 RepID=A0A9W2W9K7_PHYMC|nr:uncharacterized protein LOC129391516 [Physeter catodon]XP_054935784.1 uncharacterized protein LOC129391516 [Physeter catodon]XP_054935785.1 uncharacterized protein LOC129391516 [Physeter catodon]XP_054935786.1 uncharacterized protein LOC129391516 [Physeter catodon]XP_054935787.1 uncharacterized protein LOC129391516 [Physeter catodon]XP_054935788.1 uncharacterized protein LOC129391516 [Physeter catodon]
MPPPPTPCAASAAAAAARPAPRPPAASSPGPRGGGSSARPSPDPRPRPPARGSPAPALTPRRPGQPSRRRPAGPDAGFATAPAPASSPLPPSPAPPRPRPRPRARTGPSPPLTAPSFGALPTLYAEATVGPCSAAPPTQQVPSRCGLAASLHTSPGRGGAKGPPVSAHPESALIDRRSEQ